jgi:hypothetical protein
MSAVLLAGCGGTTPTTPSPADTGARDAVRAYCEATVRQDWRAAYAALHADSRSRFGAGEFARLAQAQRGRIGFEPEGVVVQSCEEHDAEAVAHVVFTGKAGSGGRSFKDGVSLRRGAAGWGVVLPPGFGKAH